MIKIITSKRAMVITLQKKRYTSGIVKQSLLLITIIFLALMAPIKTSAQPLPNLGTAADFAVFTSNGAVGNTGTTVINGDIGTDLGAISGFGSPSVVNGTIEQANAVTAQAAIDTQAAYDEIFALSSTVPPHAPAFGGGEVLPLGVYAIAGAGSLAGELILDAGGNPNAIFIFKFGGAFSTGASSKITLINGAQGSNVFLISGGAISMAALTEMKGTLISGPGAVSMAASGTLEGRMLSTNGAISVYGNQITSPIYAPKRIIINLHRSFLVKKSN
jgi:hypothetical protein